MDTNWAPAVCWKKKMWISEHTNPRAPSLSDPPLPLSSVCSLTERGGLLAHWEICKDNEKSWEDGRFRISKRDRTCPLPNNMSCKKPLKFSWPIWHECAFSVRIEKWELHYALHDTHGWFCCTACTFCSVNTWVQDPARLSQRLQRNKWTHETWKLTCWQKKSKFDLCYANEI